MRAITLIIDRYFGEPSRFCEPRK